MYTIEINSIAEIESGVSKIIDIFGDNKIIAFYGKMGVGKTTIIKEICRQLGVVDVVCSPTFSLVNEYHTAAGGSIFHFDFYRINKVDEVFDLGYEEYFYSKKLCLIEWPELIEQLLPQYTLCVKIEEAGCGKRIVTIS